MTRRRKTRTNLVTFMLAILVILAIIAGTGHIVGWLLASLALAALGYAAGKGHGALMQGSRYWEAYWRKYYGELYKRASRLDANSRYGKSSVVHMDAVSAYPDMPDPDVSTSDSTRRKLISQRFSGIRPLTRRDEE